MNYGFFDYKKFIEGYHGQDMFSLTHIIFMIFAFALIVTICYYGRNSSKKSIELWLKILTFVMPILELAKIIWESYFDLKYNGGFNYESLMPLYTCSLFMYVLPFASFGKGKVKECAYSFLTTIGILAGFSNFVYLQMLNTYPFWTFSSFQSIHYHFEMVLVGMFLITSNTYRPNYKSALIGWIPILFFSCLVIPVNYILQYFNMNPDYMLLMTASGAPLVQSLAKIMISNGLQSLFTILMLFFYIPLGMLIVFLYKCVFQLYLFVKKSFQKGQ